LSQHSILRSELKKVFLCGRVGSIIEDGVITGYHILYQLHGFFSHLQLDLPTDGGIEELLGMGSQAINENVKLDWLAEPMCRSLPE